MKVYPKKVKITYPSGATAIVSLKNQNHERAFWEDMREVQKVSKTIAEIVTNNRGLNV